MPQNTYICSDTAVLMTETVVIASYFHSYCCDCDFDGDADDNDDDDDADDDDTKNRKHRSQCCCCRRRGCGYHYGYARRRAQTSRRQLGVRLGLPCYGLQLVPEKVFGSAPA